MGRPKKIRESTGKAFRTDRELVQQFQRARKPENKMAAAYELWEKYFLLRMKMRAELAALCRRNNIYMPELYEEYDAEAWEKFILQFQGIRLDDVAHLPNWSIYIRLWGYWRSMNRDLLKKWFDWNTHTTPIYPVVSPGNTKQSGNENLSNIDIEIARRGNHLDEELELEQNRKIFWESIDTLKDELTSKQKQLLNMKSQGIKNREIVNTLKITNTILKDNLTFIKQRLNDIIIKKAALIGVQSNYSELLSSLGGE